MMGYVTYDFYKALYGDKAISEVDFTRLSWDACRKLDIATTGIDNVRKLRIAFPVNEEDAESVRRCVCKLIDVAAELENAEETARNARGYITREDGSMYGKVVSSVSAGNESISYSAKSGAPTLLDAAMSDRTAQERLYNSTIVEYLSGITDANGVNLLYMGVYPVRKG